MMKRLTGTKMAASYKLLCNPNSKEQRKWKTKKLETFCGISFKENHSKMKKTELLESNRTSPAEETPQCLSMAQEVLCSEKTGCAWTEPTTQMIQEMGQGVLNRMGNVLLSGESFCLKEMLLASQAILYGQKYCGVCEQEEWSRRNWLTQFTRLVEQAVTKKIPQPPLQRLGSGHPEEGLRIYLQQVQVTVLGELQKLSPSLRETPLLDCVVESFHRYVFTQLDQLLQCTLTANETFLVLHWVASVYLSKEFMGHPDIQDYSSKPIDLLILSDWLQRANNKFLTTVQEATSERLGRIIQNEKNYWGKCDLGDEEDFIKLHLDVIQVLQGRIQQASRISKLLKLRVQEICFQELLAFLEKYVESENKHLNVHTKSEGIYSFRTFNTSRELRKYVQTISSDGNEDSIKAINSLKNIEAQALELVLREPIFKAEASLKKYFKKEDSHMMEMMEEVKGHLSSLPNTHAEAHKMVVDTAYQRLTSLYLKHLLQSDQRKLKRRWIDVGREVTEDAKCLHSLFSHLNPDITQRNQALLKVEEVLKSNDVDAQKITVTKLKMECPDVSQEQIYNLLRWKGGLSQSQMKEVLDASQECFSTLDPPGRFWYLYCCCC